MLFSCMRCLCTTRSTAWFSSISILETSPMRRYSRRSRAPCAILVFFLPCSRQGDWGINMGINPKIVNFDMVRVLNFFACYLDASRSSFANISQSFHAAHHLCRTCTMLVFDCRPCASRCTSQSSRVSPISTIFTTCASLTAIYCRTSS